MLYACANVEATHRLVRTSAPQPNPMRAPGEGPGSFALESAIDELAHELGIDPLALRLRNYADYDQHLALPWSSNGLRECYRVGARAFGWGKRPKEFDSLHDGRYRLGWGMASACYPVYRMAADATVRIDRSGAVVVQCGTQDLGTGTLTILAQLAADALGVPLAAVTPQLGDSLLPEGPYSGGAHVTASITPAVEQAAAKLRQHLIEMAVSDPGSPVFGLEADRITIEGGAIGTRSGRRSEPVSHLISRSGLNEVVANEHAVPRKFVPFAGASGDSKRAMSKRFRTVLGVGTQLSPAEATGKARYLILGGEALRPGDIAFWHQHAPDTRLINEYGYARGDPPEFVLCLGDDQTDEGESSHHPYALNLSYGNHL